MPTSKLSVKLHRVTQSYTELHREGTELHREEIFRLCGSPWFSLLLCVTIASSVSGANANVKVKGHLPWCNFCFTTVCFYTNINRTSGEIQAWIDLSHTLNLCWTYAWSTV